MGRAAESRQRLTEEEYLASERLSATRHEFFNGEIFAMAGGTANHSLIATNLLTRLSSLLQKRCLVFNSDLRVKVQNTGLYTYPDAIAVCDRPELAGDKQDILLNPSLIAEVLSETTEAYDRGEKFRHYQTIPSLQTYLLVSQDKPQVEQFRRLENLRWEYTQSTGLESSLELSAHSIALNLGEIYANITFPPRPRGGSVGTNPAAAVG
jgi:Uma2 family endonuclease